MSVSPAPDGRAAAAPAALLIVAVALVAANLRMTITAVGPVLDRIGADEALSPALLGLLGSLPLLVWGVSSPAAHWLSSRFGMSNAVSLSLSALAAGTIWRSAPGAHANLWVGTVCIGVGLAIVNALMPAVIKQVFPTRVPLLMGLYSGLLGGMGAVGAGLAIPLSELPLGGNLFEHLAGWRFALLTMGAILPIALIIWIIATRVALRGGHERPIGSSVGRRIWADPLAWQVSLYMGAQSTIFYSLSSWFTAYEIAHGKAPVTAGAEMMVFQLIGIAGSLTLPIVARRPSVRRWVPAGLALLGLGAWVGMALAPAVMPVWLIVGGLAGGGSLTMALTLMAVRARTAEHATALSGMAQALGYSLAAAGPVLFGLVLGVTGNWSVAFALIWATALVQFVLGLSVGRPRFVLDRQP